MFKESSLEKAQETEPKKEEINTVPETKEEIPPGKKETETQTKQRTEFEKHKKEMREKEEEVKPEIEAKFRNALELLHGEIQSVKELNESFPSKDELRKLIERIPIFARMAEGAKTMFTESLVRIKQFHSPEPAVFIEKGMEVLGIIIHFEVLKRGGEAWLQERLEKLERKPEEVQPKEIPEETKETPKET